MHIQHTGGPKVITRCLYCRLHNKLIVYGTSTNPMNIAIYRKLVHVPVDLLWEKSETVNDSIGLHISRALNMKFYNDWWLTRTIHASYP